MDSEKNRKRKVLKNELLIKGSIWNKGLEKLFYSHCREEIHSCDIISSHGSDRVIIRIKSPEGNTAIGVINKNEKENRAFIEFAKHFRKFGLTVPEIYGVSEDYICYLIEDLGNTTLFEQLSGNSDSGKKSLFKKDILDLYKKAIKALQLFQIEAGKTVPYEHCYQFDEFGEDNIEFDLNYFRERFLKYFYNDKIDVQKLDEDLNHLKSKLLEVPRNYFMYRDFQSRNIMLKKNKLFYIDFQSGRKGALQYDLSSLLYDAKANIPQKTREYLLEFYIKKAKKIIHLNEKKFKEYFWYFAVIRILQAMGAYGFLAITKGKKKFLESIPYAVNNINMLLEKKVPAKSFVYLKKIFLELNNLKLK